MEEIRWSCKINLHFFPWIAVFMPDRFLDYLGMKIALYSI